MITWTLEIDFGRDGTFSHYLSDVSSRVRDILNWSSGWTGFNQVESNVSAHVAPLNTMEIILDNSDGALALENSQRLFYDLIYSGLMARITIAYGDTSHSFTYYTLSINEAPGEYGLQTVSIQCVCAMHRVQRARIDLEVQTNVLTSDAINSALDQAIVTLPYTSTYFFIDYHSVDDPVEIYDPDTHTPLYTDDDTGYSTIPYVGDVIKVDQKGNDEQKLQNHIADICIAEGFGRWFYQPRDVKFHFHNRHHDRLQSVKYLLDGSQYVNPTAATTTVYNDVEVYYFPRVVDTVDRVIFESNETPITIVPGKTRRVSVKYRDPDLSDTPVAALSFIDPDSTDVIVTDAGAVNVTNLVYQSSEITSTGGVFFFENVTDDDVTIDTLRVRGKLVTLYQPQIASARNGQSIGRYNWMQLPSVRSVYIDDGDYAQSIADFLVLRHKDMRHVFSDISLVITEDNFDYLNCTIGDVIQVQDAWSGHDDEYVILGERHVYDIARQFYQVTWYLRSNDTTNYFIIDTDYVDSEALIGF